jgi:hypothetical protein
MQMVMDGGVIMHLRAFCLGLGHLTLLECVPCGSSKFARDGTAGDAERKKWIEGRGEKGARREVLIGRSR